MSRNPVGLSRRCLRVVFVLLTYAFLSLARVASRHASKHASAATGAAESRPRVAEPPILVPPERVRPRRRTWAICLTLIAVTACLLTLAFPHLVRPHGERSLADEVVAAAIVLVLSCLPALGFLGAMRLPSRERFESRAALVLLLAAVVLVGLSTKPPGRTNGSLMRIYLLTKPGSPQPPVRVHVRDGSFSLTCLDCGPTSRLLVGITEHAPAQSSGLAPEIDHMYALGRKDVKLIKRFGPVPGRVPGTDVVVEVRTTFLEFRDTRTVRVGTTGTFLSSGTTRTNLAAPMASKPKGTILDDAKRATQERWAAPKTLDVEQLVGSYLGPTGNGDPDFKIDRVDPQPSDVSQFFISWSAEPTDDIFAPSGVLSSPSRETAANNRILIAGALAGAGTLGLIRALVEGLRLMGQWFAAFSRGARGRRR